MNFNCKSGAFSHQSMCDNLPKRTLCSSSVLELMSLFALLTMIYIYICIYLLCANRALQILPPVKCLWQSRDRLQIHTTMEPMLLCGIAAICVTLAPAENQPCKYNTDTKVSYCPDRASSADFFCLFLSKQHCPPVQYTSRGVFRSLWKYV